MWRFAAARATGKSHHKSGLPCQDRLACMVLPHDAFIAVLADGAGSAAMGEIGAEIAVNTIVARLQRALEEGRSDFGALLQEAAVQAREAVVSEAIKQELEPRSFASTLLVLMLVPEGGAALQIGDGVIVVSDGGNGWSWVFWPQRGEYANTTYFLTDDDAIERIQVETFSGAISDIALMSDGLEPLALHYASKAVHDPFFNGMFRPLHQSDGHAEIIHLSVSLERFLSSDQVGSRTDDDVSVILATRRK
ncbi:MAG: PP2C family serine/threonine-protein phosphatase [Nitrospirales bacterium]